MQQSALAPFVPPKVEETMVPSRSIATFHAGVQRIWAYFVAPFNTDDGEGGHRERRRRRRRRGECVGSEMEEREMETGEET